MANKPLNRTDFNDVAGKVTEANFEILLNQEGYNASVRQRITFIDTLKNENPPFFLSSTVKNIYRNGFPKLGSFSASLSGPSYSTNHEPVDSISLGDFNFSNAKDLIKYEEANSVIYSYLDAESSDLPNDNERSPQKYTEYVIIEVLRMMGIKYFRLVEEYSVYGVRPDFWLIYVAGIPVGVIEVKRLSSYDDPKIVFDSVQVNGQVFDYLKRLQSFYGIKTPFAIISTYTHWRLVWLDESSNVAMSSLKSDISNQLQNATISLPIISEDDERRDEDEGGIPDPQKRIVIASRVVSIEDQDCLLFIIGAISKMITSEYKNPTFDDPNRVFVELSEKSWTWVRSPFRDPKFKLSMKSMPSQNTKRLILLHAFTAGAQGRVWLACNSSGRVGVVKFKSDMKGVQHELEWWRRQNKNKFPNITARSIKLFGCESIFMPFCKDIPKEDFKKQEVKAAIKEEYGRSLNSGLLYQDFKESNIKYVRTPIKGKYEIIFIDGGSTLSPNENNRKVSEEKFKSFMERLE